MNSFKILVYAILVIGILGTLFTGGQVQGLFEQLLILVVVFLLVVELVPQFIVADENKASQETQ
jgi:hypothetical protein